MADQVWWQEKEVVVTLLPQSESREQRLLKLSLLSYSSLVWQLSGSSHHY